MSKEFRRTERSDILVHWTGYDIDEDDKEMQCLKDVSWRRFPLRPIDRPSLINDWGIAGRYLRRLRDTLKFGLWMVEDKPVGKTPSSTSEHDGRFKDTNIARACFTELKLSEARKHAYEFGRLGFGVKRTYLFRRAGLPMVYVGPQKADDPRYPNPKYPNWISGPLSRADKEHELACSYVKFMSEMEDLSFKYYSESEWRIVCPLDFDLKNDVLKEIKGLLVDVEGTLSEEVDNYGNGTTENELTEFLEANKENGPRYLLPLDFELAVIVYPSPKIRILAEQNPELRDLIARTRYHRWKENGKWNNEKYYQKMACYQKRLERSGPTEELFKDLRRALGGTGERMMLPMEIDLDTMSHF